MAGYYRRYYDTVNMPRRDEKRAMSDSKETQQSTSVKKRTASLSNNQQRTWYSTPNLIRRVFEEFPLVTHKENVPPQRARYARDEHTLYIFSTSKSVSSSNLSPNPACLKWQAYLKFNGIPFRTRSSNNHASPTGSLPFLLPAASQGESSPAPISASKITRWIWTQGEQQEELGMQQEAYMALIDHNIRNAWLYHLYLDPTNFGTVARPLYISSASSNNFVQITISFQLKEAARAELLKSSQIIDKQDLFFTARKAFESLSTILGDNTYFSNTGSPGLFDASLFAYTQPLLDDTLCWRNTELQDLLSEYPNLIRHREKVAAMLRDG